MPGAYLETARDAITESLEHLATFECAGVQLDVQSASLSFDEFKTPHVQLTLTCSIPESAADLAALDPRLNVRVRMTAGYRYPGDIEDTALIADLLLDDRDVSRPSGIMQLVAQSDERTVQDFGGGITSTIFQTNAEAFNSIRTLIWSALPNTPTQDDGTRMTGWVGTEPYVVKPGQDPLDAITDIADRAGDWWVRDDGLRTWRITKRPALTGSPVHHVAVGEDGTVVQSDARLGRAEWANTVLVRHIWKDASNVEREATGYAEVTSGPYAVNAVGRKVLVVERDYAGTTSTAQMAARSLVKRAVSRGRSLTITAHSAYWLRPGNTITVQLVTGPEELHLVSSVTFDLPSGLMTITTRQPDDVSIQTGS